MADEQIAQEDYAFSEFNVKISDIEERQRLMKERLLLLGQNLIEIRMESKEEMNEIKKDVFEMKKEVEKIKDAVSRLIEETENLARKEELAIVQRQIKMFEPLEYARIKDIKNMLKESASSGAEKESQEKDIKMEKSSEKRWYY